MKKLLVLLLLVGGCAFTPRYANPVQDCKYTAPYYRMMVNDKIAACVIEGHYPPLQCDDIMKALYCPSKRPVWIKP